ncbi:TetR/AcrR family transcriptional regulator [Yinghuangia sp. ASG 101]|uniref:TetR/AcrR family transcriptional regulator n=1 Tax=Yinghuangia sp. ASG 101 TaxID=2896848 RepID=UPI001E43CA21|nr:TetR/AcrR family transcriptional regulator [Yinghuangia sp. ASG 101]UGQ13026.1 TetR/AcrR family transcriptional regulator [Yinghuangia sp. ASG 101]
MNASRTARDRARAELTREIKEEARRQLAVEGAQRLSLRAVARELGMASSALYRYFPSRDDLLTQLIVDAYDGIGAAVEAAGRDLPAIDVRGRWCAKCAAIRAWARENRHEYALIYGTPVPGYQAPEETIGPASRVPVALLTTVREARDLGLLVDRVPLDLTPGLVAQASAVADATGVGLAPPEAVRTVIAWSQLSGMLGFELFGTFVGTLDPADEFFTEAVARMADFLGLPHAT